MIDKESLEDNWSDGCAAVFLGAVCLVPSLVMLLFIWKNVAFEYFPWFK